jgi:hypothetical protein
LGKPKSVRVVIWKWSVSVVVVAAAAAAAAVVPGGRTGQGKDFVSNVDCCVMLALVQCLLPPTSQVFVHAATSEWFLSREGMFQEGFWNLMQYPKRVVCLSSDHVECKRFITAIVPCAAMFVGPSRAHKLSENAPQYW